MFLGAYHVLLCAITVPYPPHYNLTGRPEWLLHIICVYIIIPICFFPVADISFFHPVYPAPICEAKLTDFGLSKEGWSPLSFRNIPQHGPWRWSIQEVVNVHCEGKWDTILNLVFLTYLSREVFRSQPHQQTFVMWFLWVILIWTVFKSFICIYICACVCIYLYMDVFIICIAWLTLEALWTIRNLRCLWQETIPCHDLAEAFAITSRPERCVVPLSTLHQNSSIAKVMGRQWIGHLAQRIVSCYVTPMTCWWYLDMTWMSRVWRCRCTYCTYMQLYSNTLTFDT